MVRSSKAGHRHQMEKDIGSIPIMIRASRDSGRT